MFVILKKNICVFNCDVSYSNDKVAKRHNGTNVALVKLLQEIVGACVILYYIYFFKKMRINEQHYHNTTNLE